MVVFPYPAGASTARRPPPSPASTRTAATWSSPRPGASPSAASVADAAIAALGRAARVAIRASVRSSRARWAAVDHCAGRARPASTSGVRRTARSEPTKRSAMTTISSNARRPADRAQRCSTTSAWVKRADREHNPVSGSTRAAVTSSQPGAPNSLRSEHSARSRSAPVASPTCAASSCQRPARRLGVSERSLAVLVDSDASSSARMRRAGDS